MTSDLFFRRKNGEVESRGVHPMVGCEMVGFHGQHATKSTSGRFLLLRGRKGVVRFEAQIKPTCGHTETHTEG